MSETTGTIKRTALIVLGWTSVALGTLGIFLPLLPTTCFLLTAAWCFGRSSPRFDRWLHANPLFGGYLVAYRTHGVIPARVKVGSLTMLWLSITASLLLVSPPVWVTGALLAVAAGVSWHVARLPTSPVYT